jgi:uncharacterized RDD family membrane protein YckC
MLCPKCLNGEISEAESCPVCGFQMQADANAPAVEFRRKKGRSADLAGMIEIDYSGHTEDSSAEPKDMPEWRQEVARRLQEIKQKRQTSPGSDFEEAVPSTLSLLESEKLPAQPQTSPTARVARGEEVLQPPVRIQPEVNFRAAMESKAANAQAPRKQPSLRALPLFQAPKPKDESRSVGNDKLNPSSLKTVTGSPAEIQKLIDNVVLKKAIPQDLQPSPIIPADPRALPLAPYENKLVLLSRAFSGMVDLIIIALCTGTFLFATDAFSGITVVDSISWIIYGLLFVATYYVYSLFFLGSINQTIGMMITDLRIVDAHEKRPLMRQILKRVSSFLPSLFFLGFGLVWGIFDRGSRCLHDRLSGTHVVRI